MSDPSTETDLVALGSDTAKAGFENERSIERILNRESSVLRRSLIERIGISDFRSISAKVVHRQKSDIILTVNFSSGDSRSIGIQVKLVSNITGFNQVDKRYVDKYQELWGFSDEVAIALKKYTGEILPSSSGRNPKRIFADELSITERDSVLEFLSSKKDQIAHTIFCGDGKFQPEWFLLVHKIESAPKVYLYNIEKYMKFFVGDSPESTASITNKGCFRLGRVTIQRKGGDRGRKSATMLQFKLNPVEITK